MLTPIPRPSRETRRQLRFLIEWFEYSWPVISPLVPLVDLLLDPRSVVRLGRLQCFDDVLAIRRVSRRKRVPKPPSASFDCSVTLKPSICIGPDGAPPARLEDSVRFIEDTRSGKVATGRCGCRGARRGRLPNDCGWETTSKVASSGYAVTRLNQI
jgi:hypothetical protein